MWKRKLVALLVALCAVLFCGCSLLQNGFSDGKKTPYISAKLISSTETQVVITVEDKLGSFELIDCMNVLEGEDFSFEISDGFITEINGIKSENGYYWMLYTSDDELSNPTWGEIEYDGEVLYSAALGAEELEVEIGEFYVWQYAKM